MKRKLEINTRGQPKVRSSSVRGFNGVRSNLEIKDVIRKKRVTFRDPEFDCPPNARHHVSPLQHKPTGVPASNAPKTSEYAFFKKLKKESGCCRSYTSDKEDNHLKSFEPNGGCRGISNMFKDSCHGPRSSLLIEKARPIAHNLILSPHNNASNNSEAVNIVDKNRDKVKNDKHSLLYSPFGALKNSGTAYSDEEVFSGKRKRLQQWASKASFPEVEELCTEGFDLVSVLLNRLFPDSDESNSSRDAKPIQMRCDTKYLSHPFSESDNYDKEFHWNRTRNLLEAEHGCYLDNYCKAPREIIPSKWDTEDSESPSTSYSSKNCFQFENNRFSSDYEGGTAVYDPYFCSNFENCGSTASTQIKGLNEQYLDEYANGGGEHNLLLGLDFESLKGQGILLCNAEMNLHSTLAASWDDKQQSLDNNFDARELYSSSPFRNYPSQFTSLPLSHSANISNWDLGRFLEEKFLATELKRFPISLSYALKYDLMEDLFSHDLCEDSSVISPQNHNRVLSKVFSEKHHPDLEAFLLFYGLGFDLGWKGSSMGDSFSEPHWSTYDGFQSPLKESPCSFLTEEQYDDCLKHRQTITHFAEDRLDDHEWSSINFQMPIGKVVARPLLLDSSGWLRSEEDQRYN